MGMPMIETIEALRLEPGDVIVVRAARRLTHTEAEQIRRVVAAVANVRAARVLVLDAGISLTTEPG